ncbi:hypothetical protein MKX03_018040 [Papaver bracteatum]|nr:hypothetical protein MKX03_018040 [Papaver bracteatum]
MKLNDYDRPLTRAIKELFIETSLTPVSDCNARLRDLYYCFCAESPQFRDGRDQDSHEFVVCLLQRLEEEEEDLALMFPNSHPRLVKSIFGGQLLRTTSCVKCDNTNEKGDRFLHIPLPIPVTGDLSRAGMGAPLSLITCLDRYIELEALPDWRGDLCYMGGNTRIQVAGAPLILIISLNRFSADSEKINDHIIFEETFDLRPYMHQRYVGSDKLEYHLIGVVVHKGSVDTGHCYAYVRGDKNGGSKEDNEDFTWYYLSDLVVREVSLQDVLQSQAYMLFYENSCKYGEGLSYAKNSSAFGPPAKPSGYGNSPEIGLGNFRVASIHQNETTHRSYPNRTSAPQNCTPISNHGSSKDRLRRSRSATSGSGKQVSSERPWKSPDESMYVSWRNSSLEDFKGNGGGRWRSDD